MNKPLAGLALAAAMLAGGLAEAQNVGIATSNPGALYHSIGAAIARAANESGLNATTQPATSPNQYIPFVNAGGIEFGIANLQEVNYALDGEAWWKGLKNPNLRIVGMLMPLREAIFVRADSGIRHLSELKGKRVTWGYTAQQTIIPQYKAFLATANMTEADIVPVNVPSVVAGANAFMAGEADAFIFAHGAAKVREADAAVGGLFALTVGDDSEEALARAREHWPTAYFVKMKAGSAPGVLEDGTYIAFPQVIFTHKDVPDDVVYAMAKAIYENKDLLASTFPAFRAFNPREMKGDPGKAQFHPGALRFYAEVGLD